MPSATHEGILAVLRANPRVLELLLTRLGVPLPPHDSLTVGSENHGQVQPVELRSDGTIHLDLGGVPVLTLIPEVQLQIDAQKLATWPSYMTSARQAHGCPALVVVVTPSRHVARWAKQPIDFGLGTGTWTPVVLGPDEIPEILDVAEAAANPELAVLSAVAHGRDKDRKKAAAIALAAIAGGRGALKPEEQKLYDYIINAALSDAARKVLAMIAANNPGLIERLRQEIRERDLAEAVAEAVDRVRDEIHARVRDEVRAEFEAQGKATAVLAFLDARGVPVTDEQRARVLETRDSTTLDRWIRLAATAATANALFEH